MVFVYIRIYFAAKARARRGIRKPPRRQPQDAVTSFTTSDKKNGEETPAGGSVDRNSNTSPRDSQRQIATIESHPRPITIPTVTCDLASDISTSDAGEVLTEPSDAKDTLKVFPGPQVVRNPISQCSFRGSTLSVNGELQQQAAALARARQPSVGIDMDMVSEFDPSSSDSGVVSRCAVVKPLKLRFCKPIFGKRTAKGHRSGDQGGQPGGGSGCEPIVEQVVPRIQKPRDPEREKKRIARKKEKRATLILGLIMGSFIACWLPFFFMYILRLENRNVTITYSNTAKFLLGNKSN
ncbi:7 transmembrane receptor (rhodopsin family) [Popillia japonica]|uniref:7 transmembrane receptor (Rhodopsin family) n=1 Tax=Popillia japonica TaxID=7064 RepID=A0AAW1MLH0_POPJA